MAPFFIAPLRQADRFLKMSDPGTDTQPDHDRLKALDGLRAMAILLVVAHHVLNTMYEENIGAVASFVNSSPLGMLIINGWVGVHLFFVLSGFLITGQLIAVGNKPVTQRLCLVKGYFKKRFFRIAPLYYLVTTILLVLAIIRLMPESLEHPWWWLGEYMKHVFFMNDYLVSHLGYVLWSLAVEVKFYLLAPLLVLGLMRFKASEKCAAIIGIMFTLLAIKIFLIYSFIDIENDFDFFTQLRSPFHMALDSLLTGVLCQFLWADQNIRNFLKKKWVARSLFAGGTLLFVYLTAFTEPYFLKEMKDITLFLKVFYFTLISMAFAGMLLGLLGQVEGYRLFEGRLLRGIAIISYSLYLIHAFLATKALQVTEFLIGHDGNVLGVWGVTFTVLLLGITPVSVLLYYFLEKPAIDWSKRPPTK